MKIKCWGSRGSIPVSGKQYEKYGGDTTCIEIRNRNDDVIIIDAGTGIRRLGNHLVQEGRLDVHFIFTHAHWDHVVGFPFFKPVFNENAVFAMHRCPYHSKFVETVLSKVMKAPFFPVKYSELKAHLSYEDACPLEFKIGAMRITPIPISHPNGGSGYKFEEDGKTFVFLTDNELGHLHPNGLTAESYIEFSKGADLLIHDAEYTPEEYDTTRTWGHSTYTDALDMALKSGAKKMGLFHLNQDRTDDWMDRIVADCNDRIEKIGSPMTCFAVGCDTTITL